VARPRGLRGDRLYFLHIPRTGGVQLRSWLEGMFRQDEIYGPDRWDELDTPADASAIPQARFVRGHFGASLNSVFPGQRSTITVLRDPVARVRSYYDFLRQAYPDDPQIRGITSFSEFIRSPTRLVADNQTEQLSVEARPADLPALIDVDEQARFMAAEWRARKPKEHLERAKARLDAMDWFATTERLGEAVDSLAVRLGWPVPAEFSRLNASTPMEPVHIEDADRQLLEERMPTDRALYAYATTELERRLEHAEPSADWSPPVRSRTVTRPISFSCADPFWGDGWWEPEPHPDGATRWTGPARESWAGFPIRLPPGTRVDVAIPFAVSPDDIAKVELRVNGEVLERSTCEHDGPNMVRSGYLTRSAEPEWTRLELRVPNVHARAPGQVTDRLIGVAVRSFAFTPPS